MAGTEFETTAAGFSDAGVASAGSLGRAYDLAKFNKMVEPCLIIYPNPGTNTNPDRLGKFLDYSVVRALRALSNSRSKLGQVVKPVRYGTGKPCTDLRQPRAVGSIAYYDRCRSLLRAVRTAYPLSWQALRRQ